MTRINYVTVQIERRLAKQIIKIFESENYSQDSGGRVSVCVRVHVCEIQWREDFRFRDNDFRFLLN